MKNYAVIGLMSGTSLDGLDIAHVQFHYDGSWHYKLIDCVAVPYEKSWAERLAGAINLSGLELKKLDLAYGDLLGESVNTFIEKRHLHPDLIVSHGHTVFHQPENRLTMQIGDGYRIYEKTGIRTVFDLRSMDVALGGQGAPLVPAGDQWLFGQYDYCLNLGGFSNISFDKAGERIAFDICPVNTVLNSLALRLGQPYDKDGAFARSGRMISELLEMLNDISYYHQAPPKSLGIEWVKKHIFPQLAEGNSIDLLHTFTHHIAWQIAQVCTGKNSKKGNPPQLLITGGGAKNSFLIELIRQKASKNIEVVIPGEDIIDFKEAIIFAFLGLLRHFGQINCLRSVTGARIDSSGGIIIDDPASSKS